MFRNVVVVAILLFSVLSSWAQEMPITTGNITQCGGFLVDDGLSASNYSNNVDVTTTVCAEAPETIVNLYFAVCALGTGDFLEIYDGPNTSAPLIGTYTTDELQSVDVTSSNNSGCLTVRFVSDASGSGNFGAEISCGPPCERPFAIISTNEDPSPIRICPGDAVTFNGAASTFAQGASFAGALWTFDDGTTSTDWPTATHQFDNPGGYVVQLELTDNSGCRSVNLPDYVVLTSTRPDFSLMTPAFDLCVGGTDWMGVNFSIPDSIFANDSLDTWISRPWIDLPDINLGGALFIPDDQSECFSDEVTFSNFDYNQTISSVNDIQNFYMNFEHSFMGDITITYICPNGSSLIVHQQGGGGTSLGEPIDIDSDLDPGVGYDYFWSPAATNGTWEDNAAGTLPAGTYESAQPWDNLLGCPLNGTWEVQVCDMWASDNGYIFDWGISFNPQLFGDLLQFEPNYGPDCDSTFWVGPNIVSQNEGCDFIQIQIEETGSYNYTYFATNDFGCTFDTTIVVDVFIAPLVEAGPDLEFDCNPLTMSGSLVGDPMDFVWQWTPTLGLSDAASPNPTVTVSMPTTYTLTGYPVGYPGCASSDQVNITLAPGLGTPGTDTDISICPSASPINMFQLLQGNPNPGGYWLDANAQPIDEIFDPATETPGNFYYNLANGDCVLSARFGVTMQEPIIAAAADTLICINGTAQLYATSTTDFDNSYTYNWNTGAVNQQVEVNPNEPTAYWVYAVDASGCISATDTMFVDFHESLSVMVDANDTICPGGTSMLNVNDVSGGSGIYHYTWSFNGALIGELPNMEHSPESEGEYCLVVMDDCETPSAQSCRMLFLEEPVPVTISSDTTTSCSPMVVNVEITNPAGTYTNSSLQFSDGTTYETDQALHTIIAPGTYSITATITSAEGCRYENTYTDYLTVFANPVAAWTATPQPTDLSNTTITFINESSGNNALNLWTFNTAAPLGSSTAENPVFTFPNDQPGTFNVALMVIDQNQCMDVEVHPVVINDVLNIYIPNSFTPNNDGVNDVFKVEGTDIRKSDFELTIFNRWGDVVFYSNDPETPWLGNHKNGAYFVQEEVYNYLLKVAAGSSSETRELKGTVTVLR